MIYIKEIKPIKISGLTSLAITFNFNNDIVNKIKYSGASYWHKKLGIWEVPLTSLSYLLDTLTYYDDIKLQLIKEEPNNSIKCKPTLIYKTNPFPHQLEAIEYGLNKDKWLLLDSMGLGKTKSVINLAEELKTQRGIKHCLVICCINTAKTNWKNEINLHSYQDAIILGEKVNSKGTISYGTVAERAAQLKEPIKEFFIITNIETFRDKDVLEALLKSKNKIDMVVVDEVHRCKSKKSKQGNNLLKIEAKYKIAMTGTLLLNNPLDSYVPLVWTENDKSILTTFKPQYIIEGDSYEGQIVGYQNMDLLKEELESCSLRRKKEEVLNLPPKTMITEYIDMSDEHRKFYNNIKKGVKEEADKIDLKRNVLALATRLRQATACPSILTTQNIESSKIEHCVDLVEQIVSQGDKVVIMNTYKATVEDLKEKLKDYKPLICTGDTKPGDIDERINIFQTDPSRKVMICTWQKMGTSITLTAASYMIHMDTAWTDGLYQQTCDRIYRIGQTKPVFIYNLVCKNTIDEHVKEMVDVKRSMSDFIVDDEMNPEIVHNLCSYIEDL